MTSVPEPFGTRLVRPRASTIGFDGIADTMKRLLLVAMLMAFSVPGACAEPALLVLGDSLSAAYGIGREQGWVTLLEDRLRREKFDYRVVNASISGETSSGGAARAGELLAREKPSVLILWLGANDGLRGLPVGQLKVNLASILRAARTQRARVLLVGVQVPPNYGSRYAREVEQAYRELAQEHGVALAPFPLEGFAERREYFQADAIHPTAAAQPVILDRLWPPLVMLLGKR
jgi:acyl-CoA thioesterase-1